MHNTTSRRNYLQVLKGLLTPFQKLKSFLVILKLNFFIEGEGVLGPVLVDLNGVVHHQIRLDQGVDFLHLRRVYLVDGLSHGSEVHNGRNSR